MKKPSSMDSYDAVLLMSLLSNPLRKRILDFLERKPSTVKRISQHLGVGVHVVYLHVNRLSDCGAVQREKGQVFITEIGRIARHHLKTLDFISKWSSFFQDRAFDELDEQSVSSLGMLQKARVIEGLGTILYKLGHMINRAEDHVYCIISQTPIDIASLFLEKTRNGMDCRIIVGKNTKVEKDSEFISEFLELAEHNLEKRIAETVHINLYLTEKEGCVLFPNIHNNMDLNAGLFGNDTEFLRWCDIFFKSKWKTSQHFARLRRSLFVDDSY